MASGHGGEAGSRADMDGRVPAEEESCLACKTRSTYSLICLQCCRRLYASAGKLRHAREAMLAHILQYSPLAEEIKSLMTTKRKRTGSAITYE